MYTLSKPIGDGAIPPTVLSYVGRKLRNDFYHMVMSEFNRSGLSQAELAKKLKIDRGQLHRHLGGPGNWTIDTAAKLLFAINGNLVCLDTQDPDLGSPANLTRPTWLTGDPDLKTRKMDSSFAPAPATTRQSNVTTTSVHLHPPMGGMYVSPTSAGTVIVIKENASV